MAMRQIFWGFFRNWFLIDPLHYPFQPFQFWLRIPGDIRNWKTTPRLGESAFECLKENSESRGVDDYLTRWVGELLWWFGKLLFKFLKFIIKLQHFKRLNQPFKISIWPKRSQACCTITIDLFKGLKKIVFIGNLVDSPTRWVGELLFDYKYLCEFEAKIGTAQNIV